MRIRRNGRLDVTLSTPARQNGVIAKPLHIKLLTRALVGLHDHSPIEMKPRRKTLFHLHDRICQRAEAPSAPCAD